MQLQLPMPLVCHELVCAHRPRLFFWTPLTNTLRCLKECCGPMFYLPAVMSLCVVRNGLLCSDVIVLAVRNGLPCSDIIVSAQLTDCRAVMSLCLQCATDCRAVMSLYLHCATDCRAVMLIVARAPEITEDALLET